MYRVITDTKYSRICERVSWFNDINLFLTSEIPLSSERLSLAPHLVDAPKTGSP